MPKSFPLRLLCALTALLLTWPLAGCGSDTSLEPVKGQVKNGTELLKSGTVQLHPDTTKGNTSASTPRAEIAEDGTYTLYTNQEEGAPAGWYKVSVYAAAPPPAAGGTADPYAPPVFLVRQEYTSAETTPLSIEVKPDAPEGHYDISLEPK